MSLRALLFRRPPDPQLIEIAFDGAIYPVQLRRHRQARRYTLRIQAADPAVVLTMPLRGSVQGGARLRGAQWRLDRGAPEAPAASRSRSRTGLSFRCAVWRTASCTARAHAARCGSRRARRRSCASPATPRIWRVACAISSSARRSAISRRRAAAMRRRSASRSSASRCAISRAAGARARQAGVLSYSWRLILAPPYVLDYLAAHEVAHLVEMNHSRRFWRVVARICPDWQRAKAWLNTHGTALHRYGADGGQMTPISADY